MIRFILIISCLSGASQLCFGQTFYYVRNEPLLGNPTLGEWYLNCFNVNTCQDTTLVQIDSSGIGFPMIVSDLAICPNGNYYVSLQSTSNGTLLAEIDPQTGALTPFDTLPNTFFPPYIITALVCGENNVLYGSGGGRLYSYNLQANASTDYGSIAPYPVSDLTFREGILYGTTSTVFLQINLTPPNGILIDSVPEILIGPTCLATELVSCDSQITYLTLPAKNNTPNQVYWLNPLTLDTGYLCDMPYRAWGIATNEFKQLDCTVRLNLDPDTSSNAPPTDWQSPPLCAPGSLMVADSDATYYSGYHTDSIRLRLLSPAPDAPLEYFTATPFGSVGVNGQGMAWMTLVTNIGASVPTSNNDIQITLRSILWHNDAASPTPGLRTVEVIAFASGGRTDTSYAYLTVPTLLSAGQDTAFAVCADGQPFPLTTPNAATGGTWSPMINAGLFSPQNDLPGTFSYMINNGLCPADTALATVTILLLPAFSLGKDTSVCSNQLPFILATPGISVWQDGSNSSTYNALQPRLYWATYMATNGCQFRDSILLTSSPIQSTSGNAQLCYGQSYILNGQNFNKDTTVCATFTGLNDCDSTHCLTLTFFYPLLALDTSICSGQTLSWLGTNYPATGIFADTILLGGCMTATHLDLEIRLPDTVSQSVSICNGADYSIGGQTFSASGQYIVEEGCDSIVVLTLDLLALPTPQITGDTSFCNGASAALSTGSYAGYEWSGGEGAASINVTDAGTYTVTVTGTNSCTATAEATVLELPPVTVEVQTGNPLCHGDSTGFIELVNIAGGTAPILFSLNGESPTSLPIFNDLPAGTWDLLVSDASGCTSSFAFILDDPTALAVELGPSPELETGDTYAIPVQINQSGMFQYSWSPPDGLDCSECPGPVLTASEEITYTLLLTTSDGCETSNTLTVRIKKNKDVYVPNIFSPNGDGRNEGLAVYGNLDVVLSIDLFQVYDRWGELLFESRTLGLNDEASGWDGKQRGRNVMPGVYIWHADIRLTDGSLLQKTGEVTVVR